MSSFKSFQRKAGHIAGNVLQKGSELLDSGKLKLAIGKEEHAISELYYQIGASFYEHAKEEGVTPDYLSAEFAEVEEHYRRLAELRSEKEEETTAQTDEVIIDITAEPVKEAEEDEETEA